MAPTYAAHRRVLVLLRLLDAVAVVLVTLIVVGVVLGLGHGELEERNQTRVQSVLTTSGGRVRIMFASKRAARGARRSTCTRKEWQREKQAQAYIDSWSTVGERAKPRR